MPDRPDALPVFNASGAFPVLMESEPGFHDLM